MAGEQFLVFQVSHAWQGMCLGEGWEQWGGWARRSLCQGKGSSGSKGVFAQGDREEARAGVGRTVEK